MDTRTLILKSSGHEVHQARSQNEVASACRERQFEVVVICQTVSDRMKRLISSVVKEHCPDVKILELYQPHVGKGLSDANSWLAVPTETPHNLTERVSELANRK
jgi:hypothetical protein